MLPRRAQFTLGFHMRLQGVNRPTGDECTINVHGSDARVVAARDASCVLEQRDSSERPCAARAQGVWQLQAPVL